MVSRAFSQSSPAHGAVPLETLEGDIGGRVSAARLRDHQTAVGERRRWGAETGRSCGCRADASGGTVVRGTGGWYRHDRGPAPATTRDHRRLSAQPAPGSVERGAGRHCRGWRRGLPGTRGPLAAGGVLTRRGGGRLRPLGGRGMGRGALAALRSGRGALAAWRRLDRTDPSTDSTPSCSFALGRCSRTMSYAPATSRAISPRL